MLYHIIVYIDTNIVFQKIHMSIDMFSSRWNSRCGYTRGQFCSPYGHGTSTCHSLEIALFLVTAFDICFLFHPSSWRRSVGACL